MCVHFQTIPKALQAWGEDIGAKQTAPITEAHSDIWPKYQAIIARVVEGEKILDSMEWGVPLQMPGKKPDTVITKRIVNVRNLNSPFWRSMLTRPAQRCLVPFTRFAEPKPNAGRQEVWFNVNAAPVSALAGIWRPSDAGNVFAFLTCEPNPLIKPIHPKAMPVILHPENYDDWLAGIDAASLAVPFPSQLMSLN